MELASMLAGEDFTDRPRSVSPVIAGFLRAYNDALEDDRRQDLYAYAARVVGTRAGRMMERARRSLCIQWAGVRGARVQSALLRLRPFWVAGHVAARHAGVDCSAPGHRRALAFLDELISLGETSAAIPPDPGELTTSTCDQDRSREYAS
jgi:hypothetical protein